MSPTNNPSIGDLFAKAIDRDAPAPEPKDEGFTVENDSYTWAMEVRPKVEHEILGEAFFKPFDYQRKIMRIMDAGKSIVVEKSRQTGVSTGIVAGNACHELLYSDAFFGHIIAQKYDTAKDRLLAIAKRALRTANLTPEQRSDLRIRGDYIEFGDHNYLRCHTAAPDAVRSFGGNWVLVEEAAFIEYPNAMWAAISGMISKETGRVAIVSTYNGDGDWFCHKVDHASELGLELLTVNWWDHPDRDEKWKERSLALFDGSEELWKQEFALQRIQRGEHVLDVGLVTELGNKFHDSCFRPVKHPIEDHEYCLGSDVSGGGRALSANCAIDLSTDPPHLAALEWADSLSHPQRREFIDAFRSRFPEHTTHWVDGLGPGAAVVQEIKPPPDVMILTGGSASYGWSRDEVTKLRFLRVPRDTLLSMGARKLENGSFVIPPWQKRAYMALRAARWESGRTKRKMKHSDEFDALMMAAWSVPEKNIVSQRGTGPVEGVKATGTLQAIMGRRW